MHLANVEHSERRLQALHIIRHQLNQLDQHLIASRRILNDLRTLRRMLLGERQIEAQVRMRLSTAQIGNLP